MEALFKLAEIGDHHVIATMACQLEYARSVVGDRGSQLWLHLVSLAWHREVHTSLQSSEMRNMYSLSC